jgi:hypothetical protein
LTLGLDPRVLDLFHGKILGYDPKEMRLSVEYDWLHPDQQKDFDQALLDAAKRYRKAKLLFKKGSVRIQESQVGRDYLRMGRFLSSDLQMELELDFHTGKDLTYGFLLVSLRGSGSRGKGKAIQFRIGQSNYSRPGWTGLPGGSGMASDFRGVPRGRSVWEITSRSPVHVVKFNGKVVSSVNAKTENDHTGFTLRAGFDVSVDILRLRITGRLDPAWLKGALEQSKQKE